MNVLFSWVIEVLVLFIYLPLTWAILLMGLLEASIKFHFSYFSRLCQINWVFSYRLDGAGWPESKM